MDQRCRSKAYRRSTRCYAAGCRAAGIVISGARARKQEEGRNAVVAHHEHTQCTDNTADVYVSSRQSSKRRYTYSPKAPVLMVYTIRALTTERVLAGL